MEAGKQVRFHDLFKICVHFFGEPRNTGSSHFLFKMPWPGDPRVNIQNDHGKAKRYQVRQVLDAIARLSDVEAAAADDRTTPLTTAVGKRKPPKKP
jgi:hypothetical protein